MPFYILAREEKQDSLGYTYIESHTLFLRAHVSILMRMCLSSFCLNKGHKKVCRIRSFHPILGIHLTRFWREALFYESI
jgi:hypothetical protein